VKGAIQQTRLACIRLWQQSVQQLFQDPRMYPALGLHAACPAHMDVSCACAASSSCSIATCGSLPTHGSDTGRAAARLLHDACA
jgi:hypothetical protein